MITMENVTFSYGNNQNELKEISLTIAAGEIVCLCGPSGCGKTTVTRVMNGLIPHFFDGELSGKITVNKRSIPETPLYELSHAVGSVFQNPKTQFFCLNTSSELAFESENQGKEPAYIKERMIEVSQDLEIETLLNRNIFHLSGGQKQLLACAAVSISDHVLYVLDEPSSNLDQRAIKQLKKSIAYWKKMGKTVVIAEHRLHYLLDVVDRFICMKDGQIEAIFSAKELCKLPVETVEQFGLRPVSIEQVKRESRAKEAPKPSIVLTDFQYTYQKKSSPAIAIPQLEIETGKITAIIGENGAGKSTFARCLCGLEKNFSGFLTVNGKRYAHKKLQNISYLVMQEVTNQLFTESVEEEVTLGSQVVTKDRVRTYLNQLNLTEFIERHPLSLSGGQQQRLAIASALASEKEMLIFDEPTSGLDFFHMQKVVKRLEELKDMGKTVLLLSHDYELLLHCADSIIEFHQGKVSNQYALTEDTCQLLTAFFTN